MGRIQLVQFMIPLLSLCFLQEQVNLFGSLAYRHMCHSLSQLSLECENTVLHLDATANKY
jgi:hypothetical protein